MAFAYYDSHIGRAHPLTDFQFGLILRRCRIERHQFVVDFGNLLLPFSGDKVIHSDGGKAVNTNHHCLAEIATVDDMIYYIIGYLVKTRRTAKYFKFFGILAFKTLATVIIKFFILKNIDKVGTEGRIFILHLKQVVAISEAHGGLILHSLTEIILADRFAKPFIGEFFTSKKRCAGKRHILGVRQTCPEIFGKRFILCAVSLVDKNNDIISFRENGIFLAFIVTEFLNKRKKYAVVFLFKHCAETVACFRLAVFVGTHKAAM